MKTIGMLGGMSWESSAEYYRVLNREAARRLGGLASAELLMRSVNFAEIEPMIHAGDWDGLGTRLTREALALERSGADLLIIATNTMHLLAPRMEAELNIPLVHIARATGEEIKRLGLDRVGLLGTRATMEKPFFKDILAREYDVETVVPDQEDRKRINRVIFDELCRGDIRDSSREIYLQIMEKMRAEGARGMILGCTEIPLLVKQEDTDLPLLDTTRLHALAALDLAMEV